MTILSQPPEAQMNDQRKHLCFVVGAPEMFSRAGKLERHWKRQTSGDSSSIQTSQAWFGTHHDSSPLLPQKFAAQIDKLQEPQFFRLERNKFDRSKSTWFFAEKKHLKANWSCGSWRGCYHSAGLLCKFSLAPKNRNRPSRGQGVLPSLTIVLSAV